jgi:hypothetical protein
MKKIILAIVILLTSYTVIAQTYPEPEFSNEVYILQEDSLVRLEKAAAKIETKMKMGGFGGAEMGYSLDGEKSTIQINTGKKHSFIISNGASPRKSSHQSDSIMQANGMDPSTMGGMSSTMTDPANAITLYKAEPGKGQRKIFFQKSGGAFSKKNRSSDKYTFSVRKIREGYWELVLDKALPKGEYAFAKAASGMGGMSGDSVLFAFGVL